MAINVHSPSHIYDKALSHTPPLRLPATLCNHEAGGGARTLKERTLTVEEVNEDVCGDHHAAHFMHPSWVHSIPLRCLMSMLRLSSHSGQRGARISLRPSDSRVHAVTSNAVVGSANGCNHFGGLFGKV